MVLKATASATAVCLYRNHSILICTPAPSGGAFHPAYRQYTALLRIDTHDRAIQKLRKTTAKPDFGEYLEKLILQDLKS
jgi:hypothetical protein